MHRATRIGLRTLGASAVLAGFCLTRGHEPTAKTLAANRPLSFEKNLGQTDRRVDFVARGAGTTAWVAGAETVFAYADGRDALDVLGMSFVGARTPNAEGRGRLETKSNYLRAEGSITGAPHFAEAVEKGLYPGVDLRWHGELGKLEYDLVVAPHADPAAVRFAMKGADELSVRADGGLVARVAGREFVQAAPVAYQTKDGRRESVAAAFDVEGGEVGFRLGAYDASRELVVDPTIDFSTYVGGSGEETGNGVALDGGATYVCGGTTSIDFPQGFGHLPTAPKGSTDAFVAKLAASGAFYRWTTYLAGRDYDEAFGVAVDPTSHAVWIVGQTFSTNFPTAQPTQPAKGGAWDAFVSEIDQHGDTLLFSTYLGGSGDDFGRGIAVGGVVSVTGFTKSTNFPTASAVQAANAGGNDAFLASWSRTTPSAGLLQSTYVGGLGDDRGYAVASFAGDLVAGAPGTVDVVTNGSFETGGGSFSGWTTSDVTPDGTTPPFEPFAVRTNGYTFASPASPWPYPGDATYPFFATAATDGTHAAVHGNGMGSNPGTIALEQDVFIPPTSDDGLISFDFRAGWFFFGTQDRHFQVEVVPNVGPTVPLVDYVMFHSAISSAAPTADFEGLFPGFPPGFGFYDFMFWNSDWNVYVADGSFPASSGTQVVQALNASNTFTFPPGFPFVFDGGYVSGPLGDLVRWNLYYGGVLVYQSGTQAAGGVPTFFPTGYAGPVDEVRLVNTTYSGTPVALDDLALRHISNPGTRDTGNFPVALPIDLTDYAGHTIRLRFKWTVPETDTGPAQFQLDNVHFLAAKGHVVVAGRTTSPDFPHKNTYNDIDHTFQDAFGGGADAFAADYTRRGLRMRWASTFGGSGEDEIRGVSVVSNGDVAVCGGTNSFNFPVVVPFQQNRRGPDDGFVAKILNGAEILDFSTFLGGGGSETANGVVLSEATGDVYVVGTTGSTDFPTTSDALQTPLVGGMNTDAFVARFGTVVNAFSIAQSGLLKHASALGGTGYDSGAAIAVAGGSTVRVAGTTRSPVGLPVVGAAQGSLGGASDAFVTKATISSVLYPAGDLVVEARAPDSLALSWKPQALDAAVLHVERTSDDGVTKDVASVAPSASEFVDTGLAPDTNYAYAIVAVRDDGSATSSNTVAGTTLPYPPAAPAGLVAAVSGSRVSLDWADASTNESGFEIQRSTGGAFEKFGVAKAGATHFAATPIASATVNADWRVVAVNRGGASAPSNVVATTTSPTLSISALSGALLDAKASGGDRFSVSGLIAGAAGFDPNTESLRIEFGPAADPIVLAVPAASRGWTSKKGVLSFSSSKGFLGGARFQLVIDARRGRFSLTVAGFDFVGATGDVSLGFALGDDAGATSGRWTVKSAGKFVVR